MLTIWLEQPEIFPSVLAEIQAEIVALESKGGDDKLEALRNEMERKTHLYNFLHSLTQYPAQMHSLGQELVELLLESFTARGVTLAMILQELIASEVSFDPEDKGYEYNTVMTNLASSCHVP